MRPAAAPDELRDELPGDHADVLPGDHADVLPGDHADVLPGDRPDERALLDLLFSEDALYDEDARLAGRDLPPRAWRASDRAVQEMIEHARRELDLAWRQLRDRARRERLAAAIRGSFEARAMHAALTASSLASDRAPSRGAPAGSSPSLGAAAESSEPSGTFA